MKANELMIGDLIKTNSHSWNDETLENKYCKVEMVGQNYLRCSLIDNPERQPYGEGTSFEPISLTPEILEKNGFSDKYAEDDLSYATDYCGDVIGVHIFGKGGIMDEMYFNYVHELQHALRLCNIKKEIVL